MSLGVTYDPNFDYLFRMPEDILAPVSAYRFQPGINQVFLSDIRLIFEGDQRYTADEAKHLKEFFNYLKECKYECKQLSIPMALRYLYAHKFDYAKSLESFKVYVHWRTEQLPKMVIDQTLIDAIQSKFFRIISRDKYYRPNILIRPKYTLDNPPWVSRVEEACYFIMEHYLHYMLVPGRVESCNVIIDFVGIGVTNVPMEIFKKIITSFQNNYKARLSKMFIINAAFVLKALWLVIKTFLDPVTEMKIKITDDIVHPELKELVHPDQLPKELGGNAELPEVAWPPTFPKGKIRDEYTEEHLTEEQLKKRLEEDPRVMASPQLGQFAREHSKNPKKHGMFPHKTLYFRDRTERRDSFNGVIDSTKVDSKFTKSEEMKHFNGKEEQKTIMENSGLHNDKQSDTVMKGMSPAKSASAHDEQQNKSVRK